MAKIEYITEEFWKQRLVNLISSTLENMTAIESKASMAKKFLRALMICVLSLSKQLHQSDSQASALL